jgi:predicted PurR-regulated permease PerM
MALVGATGFGLFFLGSALADAIAGLVERLPEIAARLEGLFAGLVAPFTALRARLLGGASIGGESDGGLGKLASAIDLSSLSGLLAGLTPALGEVLIFLATLAFFVAGRSTLRRNAILSFEERENRLAAIRVFNACEADLATYFGTTAVIYLGVGAATAAIAWSAGLSGPLLWGVLAVLLSFVPFLGPAAIVLGLLSAGLVTHTGLLAVAFPASAFLVVHLVCENAVIPAILGRRFEVNPFVVFLAIVSGTWMWGPMGAVLAVPLLLVARAVHGVMRGDGAEGGLPD